MRRNAILCLTIFTFATICLASDLQVTQPNAASVWKTAQTYVIQWARTDSMDRYVKIDLIRESGAGQNIVRRTENDGTHRWQIPGHVEPGRYKIRVQTLDRNDGDESDLFDIERLSISGPEKKAVMVLTRGVSLESPNGGESWAIDTNRRIEWTYTGVSGPVILELWKGSFPAGTIARDIPVAQRSYLWHVGHHERGTAPAGAGYSIKIKTTEAGTDYDDDSDNPFSLAPSPSGGSSTPSMPNCDLKYEIKRMQAKKNSGPPLPPFVIEYLIGVSFDLILECRSDSTETAGAGTSPSPMNVVVKMELVDMATGRTFKTEERTFMLGGSTTRTIEFIARKVDTHRYKFILKIDPENIVRESNEGNNNLEREIVVRR